MAKKNTKPPGKLICENRKARHRYEVLETFEAGVQLSGSEVKACRMGRAHLSDAYARLKGGELYLVGAHIGPYPPAGREQHEPTRTRKLLLRRGELDKLGGNLHQKGLTLIPLRFYFNARGRAKLALGVARGKKVYDRRQEIAKRESERQMARARKRDAGRR